MSQFSVYSLALLKTELQSEWCMTHSPVTGFVISEQEHAAAKQHAAPGWP